MGKVLTVEMHDGGRESDDSRYRATTITTGETVVMEYAAAITEPTKAGTLPTAFDFFFAFMVDEVIPL